MRKPSPATVIAMVALFLALGGAGVAATGGNFILGKANKAGKQTSLTGNVPTAQLRVKNTSTDDDSRGVVGLISSPSAAAGSAGVAGSTASTDPGSVGVFAENTGGGPALKAVVDPGAAPLTVNSSTKVANLNADQLDGMNSTQFVRAVAVRGVLGAEADRGGGSVATIHDTMTASPGSQSQRSLGTFAGPSGAPLLEVTGNCFNNSNGAFGANVWLTNVSPDTIVRWLDDGGGDPTVILQTPGVTDASPLRTAVHAVFHGRTDTQFSYTLDTWTVKDGGILCIFELRLTIEP